MLFGTKKEQNTDARKNVDEFLKHIWLKRKKKRQKHKDIFQVMPCRPSSRTSRHICGDRKQIVPVWGHVWGRGMTAEGQECTSGVTVDMFSILLVLVVTQVLNWSELTKLCT